MSDDQPELVEVSPGLWRVRKPETPPAKSSLPMPHVISDTMPPTEQVNGKFYESKSAFRRVGRSLGLTEVGNEKPKPRRRYVETRETKVERRRTLERVVAEYRQGRRPRAEQK
jgi:hypothetical protein